MPNGEAQGSTAIGLAVLQAGAGGAAQGIEGVAGCTDEVALPILLFITAQGIGGVVAVGDAFVCGGSVGIGR